MNERQSKATPGPWVRRSHGQIGPAAGGGVICEVWAAIGSDEADRIAQSEANELLIASAPELAAENRKLRILLALRVAGHRLYGDDGHLQDNTCFPFIDFRCDSADEIAAKLDERGRAAITKATQGA